MRRCGFGCIGLALAPSQRLSRSSSSSSNIGSSSSTATPQQDKRRTERTTPQSAEAGATAPRRQLRRHPKLHKIAVRELKEEYLRDFRPPMPPVPTGWSLKHDPGSNRFDLQRRIEVRDNGVEHMHCVALMEIKEYEHTYRMDTGEREEEEHLIFSLFIEKEKWSQGGGGGLEFTLTSIDHELVLDNLTIHSTREAFADAKEYKLATHVHKRDRRYRGPMVGELSEELNDEILDYLDERGIHNGFAEYMMAQAHYLEQACYEDYLSLLKQFAK
jgi:hypothetical protein